LNEVLDDENTGDLGAHMISDSESENNSNEQEEESVNI
jgi:hypothetical protein